MISSLPTVDLPRLQGSFDWGSEPVSLQSLNVGACRAKDLQHGSFVSVIRESVDSGQEPMNEMGPGSMSIVVSVWESPLLPLSSKHTEDEHVYSNTLLV